MFCSITPTHCERLFVIDSLDAPQNICCLLFFLINMQMKPSKLQSRRYVYILGRSRSGTVELVAALSKLEPDQRCRHKSESWRLTESQLGTRVLHITHLV